MAQAIITPSRRLIVGPRGLRKPVRPVLDPSDPINRGLIGCWLLGDVAAGVTRDLSGNNYNGTFGGTVSLASSHHGGTALSFGTSPAHNNRVSTGLKNINYLRGSVVWWLYPTEVFNSTTIRVQWGQLVSAEFSGQISSDNNWYLGWNGASDTRLKFAATAGSYAQNTWQCYVFDWGPSGSALWRNGVLVSSNGTDPSSNVQNINTALVLGNFGGSGVSFGVAGREDGFRVYAGRNLTTAEKIRLYAEPYAGIYEAGPRWRVGSAAVAATVSNRRTLGPRVGSRSVY